MSENEIKEQGDDVVDMAAKFEKLREFEVTLENGEKRMAKILASSADEQRRAEEHMLALIAEKSSGEPDPITGRVIKLPTKDNMMEYAKEKGMWTDDDDTQFSSLENTIRALEERLAQGKIKKSEAYNIAVQIVQHRNEIYRYNQRRWFIYELTADAAGEDAYHKYLCVATAVWENGERIFSDISSIEKINNTRNHAWGHYWVLIRAANNHLSSVQPEVQFLCDYGFVDIEGNLYDVAKKEIVLNLYEGEDDMETGRVLGEFYDDDNSTIEVTGMAEANKANFAFTSEIRM